VAGILPPANRGGKEMSVYNLPFLLKILATLALIIKAIVIYLMR
jgi:hypothetical protein